MQTACGFNPSPLIDPIFMFQWILRSLPRSPFSFFIFTNWEGKASHIYRTGKLSNVRFWLADLKTNQVTNYIIKLKHVKFSPFLCYLSHNIDASFMSGDPNINYEIRLVSKS